MVWSRRKRHLIRFLLRSSPSSLPLLAALSFTAVNGQQQRTKKTRDIEETKLHFLTSVVASGCLLLEQAIFTVIQMLLVRAGIETNPGPTSPTNPTCCNAFQHFKRVRNTIEKAKENFKSKVTQDTLTKKVIEIEETGEYFSLAINTE